MCLLAESFLTAGFAWVIVGGNGLHTPEEINDLVAFLDPEATLVEIAQRIESGEGRLTGPLPAL